MTGRITKVELPHPADKAKPPREPRRNSAPLTIDLFCGAGGITEGFRQAGYHCLYGNDCMPEAVKTFALNHPEATADSRDIEQVDPAEIRKQLGISKGSLDVLIGGPPCQGFSINAPERFLRDPRNKLFKDYVRFFGYAPQDHSQAARQGRDQRLCPFLGAQCTKTLSDGQISGACTLQAKTSGPVIYCPIRLYSNNYQILHDVARLAFGPQIPLLPAKVRTSTSWPGFCTTCSPAAEIPASPFLPSHTGWALAAIGRAAASARQSSRSLPPRLSESVTGFAR